MALSTEWQFYKIHLRIALSPVATTNSRRYEPIMQRHVILGLGAGQCGLPLLAEILNKQRGTCVSQAQLPWLPWSTLPDAPGIRERLHRIVSTANDQRVGDVASFYLPYVEEAIKYDSRIRIVCLKRPRDEVVRGFCQTLDRSSDLINHWAKEPAPGWSHDLFTTRIYPQYDATDREEGIGRYWDEYDATAGQFQSRYPGNFRIWDADVLENGTGVREVLTFAGIPVAEQFIVIGKRPADAIGSTNRTSIPTPATKNIRHDPRKCVVLVPAYGQIQPDCEKSLKVLEQRGYSVRRVAGYAAVDQARSQMATDALREGFDETLWIDSDIGFDPDAVERLRSHDLPIVCGIYPKKGQQALACNVMPGTKSITFGQGGWTHRDSVCRRRILARSPRCLSQNSTAFQPASMQRAICSTPDRIFPAVNTGHRRRVLVPGRRLFLLPPGTRSRSANHCGYIDSTLAHR